MPVINVKQDWLYNQLGKVFTETEFQNLCFDFGIELDEITSEREMLAKMIGEHDEAVKQASDEKILKIDIPANRYDILCGEGLSQALNVFLGRTKPPVFKTQKSTLTMKVSNDTKKIRPFVVCAVLRNIKFTEESYQSFIDLQDKLHHNICRKRTLVAIGTHDLDTLKPPFSYEALSPKDIKFIPLSQTKEFRADELLELYETNPNYKHLKPYVPIIKESPVYPVIYDSNRTVLSLPPIINGEHSKITLNTKNVFIECTATDRTKAYIVLNMIVCAFSQYCEQPFVVEQVDVEYADGTKDVTPDLSVRNVDVSVDYICKGVGVKLTADEICKLLTRMSYNATVKDKDTVSVCVPPTRSDVLHPCDIMEDVGIAYGYNNIPKTTPQLVTIGKQVLLNKLTDALRQEVAMAGYTEVLTLVLCSHDDNFAYMNKKDDGKTAVKLANPKTVEFQVVRTSLLPGLLKTFQGNLQYGLPVKIFEISDVVVLDKNSEVGAKNRRKLAALYCPKESENSSGFEIIHGLLDRLMEVQGIPLDEKHGYCIKATEDSTFFPKRAAGVYYKGKQIGVFGVLHPLVLQSYGLKNPSSALEIDIQELLDAINQSGTTPEEKVPKKAKKEEKTVSKESKKKKKKKSEK